MKTLDKTREKMTEQEYNEKCDRVQLICCVREWIYQETINFTAWTSKYYVFD